jgi:16S rRNA (guanine527-N7)-methyltransferase
MNLIIKYFPDLTSHQRHYFAQLQELYTDWNSKINVISHKDIDNLYEHHVLHSLAIAKLISFKPGTSVMDIGTGGGFPGIPLAIMFPDINFYLVDSIGKKIKVVNEIIGSLGLKNAKAEQIRAEQVNQKFDFIVSRAVADLPTIYGWVKNKIKSKSYNLIQNGLICMKGGDITEETNPLKNHITIYKIENYFSEDYFKDKKLVYIYFGKK